MTFFTTTTINKRNTIRNRNSSGGIESFVTRFSSRLFLIWCLHLFLSFFKIIVKFKRSVSMSCFTELTCIYSSVVVENHVMLKYLFTYSLYSKWSQQFALWKTLRWSMRLSTLLPLRHFNYLVACFFFSLVHQYMTTYIIIF